MKIQEIIDNLLKINMEEKCFVFFLATCEHQWLHQGIKAIFIYIYFKGIKPFLRTQQC